ncbi:1-phosphofructokinase [Clostridium pasteurianum DSM 525 = ATCC 6013]|uniref:Tagatose-6-phosphate kinase n=1 Tax=Clostridium pasteurianum DSM 525 = ATCC 6013 TaxID=1262449 RepID=A0A0H3J9J3_CLOPA|nr:1-phosphofructokinase [Clostridium pasteurianum]AJA50022.1 1-phosphofructokinase [Clostridium pasteurianum DSM 525 = ATCC 6013]AJA54010.1 1-phosphofructokinase [Clostridium pasteurianum DSM 525 = ATCC 6013]AOZ77153.1 1-phosphofructokinase [Clostridium pasteurianum DSM 525 = ATCC 6013]AOZ80950.1 1-phosphofructokinase [Clostridium pasteurianum]ELP59268.1 1-phosphofructokinase [Clostridium pasteurianum DSM 525 = ATCC 6013]
MIYTVTFNPAIDYVINVDDFKAGEVNRVVSEEKFAGGKGINVSRVLNNLGVKSKALGFIGGFTGKFIVDSLEDQGVQTDFVEVLGDTRINVKLKSKEETEINGGGPIITKEDLQKLFNIIGKLGADDYLVLAGNVQNSVPRDIYAVIQEKCATNKVKVVVDTTGEALVATLKNKPFLIKPNNHELGEIFNVELEEREEIIKYAQKLRDMGALNVIISMAAKGALLICDSGVYHASPAKGTVKNSVGAGDSVIAGFLASYSKNSDIVEAFRWGATSGSATAFSKDLCKKEDVEHYLPQVIVTRLQ